MTQMYRPHFYDQDATGGGLPASDADVSAPNTKPPEQTAAPALTQADVDRIIQDRLARERATRDAEVAQRLQALGIEGGLSGLDKHLADRASAERQRLEGAKKFEDLYNLEKSAREKVQAEKDREIAEMREQRTKDTISRQALQAAVAAGAVAPDQVVALVSKQIKADENGVVYVVDEMGNRLTDGKGNFVDVSGLISAFLERNPHFKSAAPGRGANSQPAGVGATGKPPVGGNGFDAQRALTDSEYAITHQKQMQAHIIANLPSRR